MNTRPNPSSIESITTLPRIASSKVGAALRGRGWGRGGGRARRKGFTLIEVLAALVLLAIVLPAAMRGVTAAASAASSAQKRTKAAALAASKLQEILATGQYANGGLSGDFGSEEGPEYNGFRWEAQTSNWNQPGFNSQDLQTQTLEQLDLKVTWRGKGGDQSITLSTLVYSNSPVGPAAQPPVVTDTTKRGPLLGNVTSGGF
ncbi:MAG TPA: prepilin-type N-terminal cleavage/methylation domain-containing protein [Tepidisphaeraceae bacterium]